MRGRVGDAYVKDSITGTRIQWDPTSFYESNVVLVGFRKLGETETQKIAAKFTKWQYLKSMVWLNGLAVSITRPSGVTSSNGNMCHAELMIQVSLNQWARFSINKKQYIGNDAFGAPQFEWGTVHATVMGDHESEWRKKYCFLQFGLQNREHVGRMFDFLAVQMNAPFNYWGYILNHFFICARIGTSHYNHSLRHDQAKWYCTEIITAALQCGAEYENGGSPQPADDNTWQTVVCNIACYKTSPNSLFHKLSGCSNVTKTMAPNSDPQLSLGNDSEINI